MPITLKPNEVKYKGSNGQYGTMNVIADQTTEQKLAAITAEGTAQKNAVNSAGAAQVTAIENKGNETRNSIPENYTVLSENVENLNGEQATQNTRIDALEARLWSYPSLNRRVENLEAAAKGNLYREEVDAAEAYEKQLESDVMPWALLDMIGAGKTLVWNQINNNSAQIGSDRDSGEGVIFKNMQDGRWHLTGTANPDAQNIFSNVRYVSGERFFIEGHKYLFGGSTPNTCSLGYRGTTRFGILNGYGSDCVAIAPAPSESGSDIIRLRVNPAGGEYDEYASPVCYDLTAMFGTEIAETINTPEDAYALGVPRTWQPYSEPTLRTFSPDKVISKGRNLYGGDALRRDLEKLGIDASGNDVPVHGNVVSAKEFARGLFRPDEQYTIITKTRFDGGTDSNVPRSNFAVVYTDGTPAQIPMIKHDNFNFNIFVTERGKSVSYIRGAYTYNSSYHIDPDGFGVFRGDVSVEDFVPYHDPTEYDLSALVRDYFGGSMKSVGTVRDEIDFERGVAIQRVGSVDLSNYNFSQLASDPNIFYRSGNTIIFNTHSNNLLTARYETVDYTSVATLTYMHDKTIKGYGGSGERLYIRDTDFNNANDFNAAMSGVILYGELLNPIETLIDPADLVGLTDLNIEAGGSLIFTNDKGDDFRVPLPNQETFMIKLGGAS